MLMRNKCPSIKTDSSTTDTLDYHSPELEDYHYYSLRSIIALANSNTESIFFDLMLDDIDMDADDSILVPILVQRLRTLQYADEFLYNENKRILEHHGAQYKIAEIYKETSTNTQPPQSKAKDYISLAIDYQNITINQINSNISKISMFRRYSLLNINTLLSKQRKINQLMLINYKLKQYSKQLSLLHSSIMHTKKILKHNPLYYSSLYDFISNHENTSVCWISYCISICSETISRRLLAKYITVIKQDAIINPLLNRLARRVLLGNSYTQLKNSTLSDKCIIFIYFLKYLYIVDLKDRAIDQDFWYFYRPLLLEIFLQQYPIDSMDFVKATSIMQHNNQTIALWTDFAEQQLYIFYIWYYDAIKELRESSCILPINKLRKRIKEYYHRFTWISQSCLASACAFTTFMDMEKPKHFIYIYLKLLLQKLFNPLLATIMLKVVLPLSKKDKEKYGHRIDQYIYYTLLHESPYLSKFTFREQSISASCEIYKLSKYYYIDVYLEEYYNYLARPVEELLNDTFNNQLAKQFSISFYKIVLQCINCSKCVDKHLSDRFKVSQSMLYYIDNKYSKLRNYLSCKKSEQNKEKVYELIMKLQFNSFNYMLLLEACKYLGPTVVKEIYSLRNCVYKNFYG